MTKYSANIEVVDFLRIVRSEALDASKELLNPEQRR